MKNTERHFSLSFPSIIRLFSLCLFLVLGLAPSAFAHKVYLFAWVEGDRVYTESYFGAKRKVINGTIRVFDSSGKQLLEGKTDNKGEFSFKPPKKTDLRIVLEASMGHRAEFVLKADEFGISSGEKVTDAPPQSTEIHRTAATDIDSDRLKEILGTLLDQKLMPIHRDLARLREEKGPGATEIFGGIGYILGLMGVAFYFKGKKKIEH